MAQRIVTICDAHQVTDEEVPGFTWTVTLHGPGQARATTWEVDLCEDDGKTLVDLGEMLGTVGRVTEGPKRSYAARRSASSSAAVRAPSTSPMEAAPVHRPGSVACPVEGCSARPISMVALQSHVRARHGMSYAEATGAPLPFTCPDPECERRFPNRQGMSAHHRSAHGGPLPQAGES